MFGFTVQVTDAASATASRQLAISITGGGPSITTASLSDGHVAAAYTQTLSATGGVPPYAWSISGGALPSGLSLSGAGVISGTPANGGTSTFTVQVTDSASASATMQLSITITGISITTSSMSTGKVGVMYTQTLSASGGTPPYSWGLASGSLPGGLTLGAGGTVSGTPGSSGTFGFTAQVTDAASATATSGLSITVVP
jgi:hypothetical protein